MLQVNEIAPHFTLPLLSGNGDRKIRPGEAVLLLFFEADCPTCALTIPYLNRLSKRVGFDTIIGISQDEHSPTAEIVERLGVEFTIVTDPELSASRLYNPTAVPSLFLLNRDGRIANTEVGFDKKELNEIAIQLCREVGCEPFVLAEQFDGNPDQKPGCVSRHLEPVTELLESPTAPIPRTRSTARASRIELSDHTDLYQYCIDAGFADGLPVIPPTVERVEQFLKTSNQDPDRVIGLVPPNYCPATVEKIAANGVMAGCAPQLLPTLITLVRAACDERFNLHGVQATTHFAAPLIIVNGPIRRELGFASRNNVFSNVARTNSSVGRAFQLILTNLGGARPGGIDMSTLGNPGKFSYCIAENEEENPWEPLHTEAGFKPGESTVTLFAAEPPKGVSEHNAREARTILKAICRTLGVSWSYRVCAMIEAIVVLCPEHVRTIRRDGLSKSDVKQFLFENTGIPVREYKGDGEGMQYTKFYKTRLIDGENCYLKFNDPGQIKIVVAGGTAGKFSAVISSWAAGPRGSQMVTYPIH
jgi:peroxiredoxin